MFVCVLFVLMYWILKLKFNNILIDCYINKYSLWLDVVLVVKWVNGNLNLVEFKNISWRIWVVRIFLFLFEFSFWKMIDFGNSFVNLISLIFLFFFLNCKFGWIDILLIINFFLRFLGEIFLIFVLFDI